MMEPFARRGFGQLWLASMSAPVFRRLMYRVGVEDRSATPPAELDAYVALLKRGDGGRAFLRIMRASSAPLRNRNCTSELCATAATRCRSCGAPTTRP